MLSEARYLIRLDDACATARWPMWDAFEDVLTRHDVRPLVAVVPQNEDPELICGHADPAFWSRVRRWQAAGWKIGLHGHTHVFTTSQAGIVPLNRRSEFAGLPLDTQRAKIESGLRKFATERVRADAWIAPAHSFDRTTLQVLAELGVKVVSDGFSTRVSVDRSGLVWVPQQLWDLEYRRRGVWTVCYHPNTASDAAIRELDRRLGSFRGAVSNLEALIAGPLPRQTSLERTLARARIAARKARSHAGVLRSRLVGRSAS